MGRPTVRVCSACRRTVAVAYPCVRCGWLFCRECLDDWRSCAECSGDMSVRTTTINEPLGEYLISVKRYGSRGGYRGAVILDGRLVHDTGTLAGEGARDRCLARCREWAKAGVGGGR